MNNLPNTLPPTDEVAELKPCPFCGSADHLSAIRIGSAANGYYPLAIRCRHLDCDEVQGPTGNGKAEAVAAWNLRTPARPAPTDVELDELEKVRALLAKIAHTGQSAQPDHWLFRCMARDAACEALRLIAALRAPAVPREVEGDARLRKALRDVSYTLQVPAAEYVPAIRDAWDIIDAALRASPTPAGGEGKQGLSVSRDHPCGDAQEHCPQSSEITGKEG